MTGPVVIDSREAVPGALFAALPGERVDGRDFAAVAAKAGAVAVLSHRPIPDVHDVPVIVTADVTVALGALAREVLAPAAVRDRHRDHRVVGQDLDQGPHRPGGRPAGPHHRPRRAPSTTSSACR